MKKTLVAVVLAVAMTCAFADCNVGVGLGRKVMGGKKGKFNELVAWWLSAVTLTEPLGIICGSSGYEENATIKPVKNVALFINDNMDAVAMDIAAGDGEYLNTVSEMFAVADTDAFKAAARASFNDIYSSSEVSADEIASKLAAIAL